MISNIQYSNVAPMECNYLEEGDLTMKRIFLVMLVLVLSIAFTSTAFAALKSMCANGTLTANCDWQSTSFGGGEYRPSAKVVVRAFTTNINYCVTTQHSGSAGNTTAGRQYGTLSSSPQILAAAPVTNGPTACGGDTGPLDVATWNK
jgi:hypothetical protein